MPRRQFIRLSALGAAAAGFASALLAGCGDDDDTTGTGGTSGSGGSGSDDGNTSGGVKLSRPDDPATLPTFDDIPAIADGLPVESGKLKVYNY
jgi:hypothetical protein